MYRFTNKVAFRVSTSVKNNSVVSYYKITLENNNTLNDNEREKIEESKDFVQSIDAFTKEIDYFRILISSRIEIENTSLDQPLRHDMLTSPITVNINSISLAAGTASQLLKKGFDFCPVSFSIGRVNTEVGVGGFNWPKGTSFSMRYIVETAFLMFGVGIRICPGRKKLTTKELKCLIASIYRKYGLELADMDAPLK
ncbi:cytochrome P450 [Rhizophagus clarus]|uniref:Cytochrome P450 n=1 Tax=Rhizophagus clarus TaxID=94130 RepID=A0A8H3KXJ2_9GLOM|nr:cytochrome P450 [Rhizophagus clarus]